MVDLSNQPLVARGFLFMNDMSKSKIRKLVWDKTEGKCWYCGKQTNPWRDFCIDHIIPKTNGGNDEHSNLVPCCRICNVRKSNRTIERLREIMSASEGMQFTSEQKAYLRGNGIDLPEAGKYTFFFEKMELTP